VSCETAHDLTERLAHQLRPLVSQGYRETVRSQLDARVGRQFLTRNQRAVRSASAPLTLLPRAPRAVRPPRSADEGRGAGQPALTKACESGDPAVVRPRTPTTALLVRTIRRAASCPPNVQRISCASPAYREAR